jgi:hypothetical protein
VSVSADPKLENGGGGVGVYRPNRIRIQPGSAVVLKQRVIASGEGIVRQMN